MSLRDSMEQHPFRTTWLALAAGMVIILLVAVRGQGFTLPQYAAVVLGAVGLAAAAAWLILQGED